MRLSATDNGVQFAVRAQPKASRDAIVGLHGDALKIAVTAAPQAGKANQAIVRLLAKTLGVGRAAVRIVAGHASRDKVVAVDGLTPTQLQEKLTRIIGSRKGKAPR